MKISHSPLVVFGALLAGSLLSVSAAQAQKPPVKPTAQTGASKLATTQALSNAKQLGIACLMKAADSSDAFKIVTNTFQKDISSYLKNKNAFTSPLDKPGTQSFQFNRTLKYVPQKNVKRPADTVMIYEGAWGQPLFRYNGNAIMVFADGHAKQISPAQAKGLLWKP